MGMPVSVWKWASITALRERDEKEGDKYAIFDRPERSPPWIHNAERKKERVFYLASSSTATSRDGGGGVIVEGESVLQPLGNRNHRPLLIHIVPRYIRNHPLTHTPRKENKRRGERGMAGGREGGRDV